MRLLYCGSGWRALVENLDRRLSRAAQRGRDDALAGARIETWDRSTPLVEAVRGAHVLLPSNARIDADSIAAAQELVLIQQPAAGIDAIDLDAARARGIPVCNAPGTNHIAVAEVALLLILSLARRLPRARAAFAAGAIGAPAGIELTGKTLGIIGLGHSGSALAERARGLDMHVLGVNSRSTKAECDRLLGNADVISLHCPLTEATRGLIDARALATMKPGALLVNCARGAIIDREAVTAALARGQLGGLGLDTPWDEPWDPKDPLYARDDVVVLPHVGGATEESFGRIADVVCENLARLRRGVPLLHRVA